MKKIIITIAALVVSTGVFAQSFDGVKELSVKSLSGKLDITAAQDQKTTVTAENLSDKENCILRVKKNHEGELDVRLVRKTAQARCGADIVISTPAKTQVDIDASNTKITVDGLTKELDVDVRNSVVSLTNIKGKLDIEALNSTVKATGVFKKVDIGGETSDIQVVWLEKAYFIKTELDGTNTIVFTLAPKMKKPSIDDKDFHGELIVQ